MSDLDIQEAAPLVDVNEAFMSERLGQIDAAQKTAERREAYGQKYNQGLDQRVADGRLINLGNGNYKVNEPGSWDDGEILTRITTAEGQSLILPQHGLDETRGQVALYSSVPVWHNLGNIVKGGLTNLDEVLDAGGINYEVHKVPARYRNPVTGVEEIKDGVFHTCRMDNGKALGTVGSVYEVFQNREAFQLLLDLVDKHEVKWESAGALRDGAKIFASMLLPIEIRVDPNGVCDEIKPFLVAINDHTGKGLYKVLLTPWRPVCGNTERFAVRDAKTSWGIRHTGTLRDRLSEARRTLGLSVEYYEQFAAEEEALAQTTVEIDAFRKTLDELFGELDDDAKPRARTNHEIREATLLQLWEENTAKLGRTGYAAERALTEYADWKTRLRPGGRLQGKMAAARATAVLEDSTGPFKTRAHRQLMTLTNR